MKTLKLFSLLMFIVLSINMVSALDFDNIKPYDEQTRTYEIINWFGLGETLANIKLISPLNLQVPRGYQKVAEIGLYNFKPDYNNAFSKIDFYNIKDYEKNDLSKTLDKTFDYKYKDYIIEEMPIYENICVPLKILDEKSNITETCQNQIIDYENISKEVWIKFNDVNDLPKDRNMFIIGIFTDVKKGDKIEWVPSFFGERLTAWATWTESLAVDGISFYDLDDDSANTSVRDSLLNYTGTTNGNTEGFNAVGLIDGALNLGGTYYIQIPTISSSNIWSLNIWVKGTTTTDGQYLFDGREDGGGGMILGTFSGDLAYWDTSATTIVSSSSAFDGDWHNVIINHNAGTVKAYFDGVLKFSTAKTSRSMTNDNVLGAIRPSGGGAEWTGTADLLYIWDRLLTDDSCSVSATCGGEIEDIYNNGNGLAYSEIIGYPSVILTSPNNNSQLLSANVVMIATVTDDQYVENVTLYLDGSLNETRTSHVNGSYTFSKTMAEGLHNWSILAYNNQSLSNQSETRYFNITILAPTIILNSPEDNIYSINHTQNFNGSVYDNGGVVNVSLLIDGGVVETNTTGINNTNYLFNYDFGADGSYTWAYKSFDTDNESSTSTRNIIIDSTPPTLTINNNTNEHTFNLPINKSLNMSVIDNNIDTCIYWTNDNLTNNTITCNSLINISFTTGGNKTIYTWVNDSVGYTATAQDSFYINYLQENISYISPVIELDEQIIYLNVTATEINTFNANLTYNNTNYLMTTSNNGTLGQAYVEITNPGASTTTFNFTYLLDGETHTTSNYNQTINALTPIEVTTGSCSDLALTFILQDEVNETNLTGVIDYNIKYGPSNNNEYLEAYGTIENTTKINICINATATEYYYIGYGEIQYRVDGYVDRRFYLFEDSAISNNTYVTHYLRELPTTTQTSFLLTLEDTDLNKYSNKYTALWRWYPGINDYKIVEMGKTDEDGQTVIHVRTEDVDYRTALYELNGSLIKFDSPRRFLCTSSPCSLNIVVGEDDEDLTAFYDIESGIVYNETTGIITFTYNDPNQLTQSMRLRVDKLAGNNIITLCDDTSSGFSGIMSCNISAYSGTFKVTAYRTASPEVPINQKMINTANTLFKSSFGLFFSAFIWLAIVLSALMGSPILTLIFAVVGLIPALFFGSINLAIFTGLIVMIAIVLHFIKRSLE